MSAISGGLIDFLVTAAAGGDLPWTVLPDLIYQVYNASWQSSIGLLGNGLVSLLASSVDVTSLGAEREMWARTVREMLRVDPPVQATGRRVNDPVSLGPASLTPGDLVLVMIGAAKRDPVAFDDPGTFKLGRSPKTSLGFGGGIHHCLGASLATLQAEVVISQLFIRARSIRVDAQPPSNRWPTCECWRASRWSWTGSADP